MVAEQEPPLNVSPAFLVQADAEMIFELPGLRQEVVQAAQEAVSRVLACFSMPTSDSRSPLLLWHQVCQSASVARSLVKAQSQHHRLCVKLDAKN